MFQGNPRLRKAGQPPPGGYTPDDVNEWVKCSEDPLYFIQTYVRIKDVDTEDRVLFKMRAYQKEMLSSCFTNRFVIVKLPRQAGKTVAISAVLLWHILFRKNYSVLIAAHKSDKARDVLSMIKSMYEDLPPWLQQGILEWNKGNIILEHGSRIRASSTSGTSARGDTYNMVYLDEMAFVMPHIADEFIKSVIPTISSGKTTKVFITSTPRGFNHFHKMWVDATVIDPKTGRPRSQYKPIEIKWDDVPGRDAEWRQGVIDEFGQAYFDQEYGAEFLGSSMTLISGAKLGTLAWINPIKEGEHYRIFAEPQRARQYVITVDVSEGVGGDFSVAMVFDITKTPYEVVAIYANRYIAPEVYPTVLRQMGQAYNMAPILVEVNFGGKVADILHTDLEYENTIATARNAKKGQSISGGFAASSRLGFIMDKQVKRIGCAGLKSLVENDVLILNDYKTIYELHRFSKKKDSFQAESGNDDHVVCLVSFAWLVDQGYIRDLIDGSARARIAEMHRQKLEEEATDFGFRDTGQDEMLETMTIPMAIRNEQAWMFPELKGEKDPYSKQESDPQYTGSNSPNVSNPWMGGDDSTSF